jgi:hypothetical protein
VQDLCETAMLNVVRWALKKTGSKKSLTRWRSCTQFQSQWQNCRLGTYRQHLRPARRVRRRCGSRRSPCPLSRWRAASAVEAHAPCVSWPFDDPAIESTLKTYKIRYCCLSDPAAAAAEFLSQGKILGWYQDRMEFGPRALGSRSIIADPRDPEMNTKVNNAVKFREWWASLCSFLQKRSGP